MDEPRCRQRCVAAASAALVSVSFAACGLTSVDAPTAKEVPAGHDPTIADGGVTDAVTDAVSDGGGVDAYARSQCYARFAGQFDGGPIFCDDFERTADTKGEWAVALSQGGAEVQLSTLRHSSGSNSLRAESVPTVSKLSARGYVFSPTPAGIPLPLFVELDVFVEKLEASVAPLGPTFVELLGVGEGARSVRLLPFGSDSFELAIGQGTPSEALPLGAWHHVVVRFEADRVTAEATPKAGGPATTTSVGVASAGSPQFSLGLPLADGFTARIFIDDVVVHR